MCDFFFFSPVIALFHATLFCGQFNGSSFTYSNVILLINPYEYEVPFLCWVAPSLNWDTESHMEIVKQ